MAKKPVAIVSRTYSTAEQEPSAQFGAWRDYIAPIYDVVPIGQDTSAGFCAEVQAWHLGAVLIGRPSFAAHRFFRDRSRIGCDGLTHILVQLCLEGGFAGIADGRAMAVSAGEVAVIDLARPLALEAMPTRTLDVHITVESALVVEICGRAGCWDEVVIGRTGYGGVARLHPS